MTWRGCFRCALPVYEPHEICTSCTIDSINEANANDARVRYERECRVKLSEAARRAWRGRGLENENG